MIRIAFVIAAMTYLLAVDYFPHLVGFAMGKWIALGVIAILFLSGGIAVNKEDNKRLEAKWMLVSTVYIIVLLFVLPMLGGESTMGISLDNPFVWLLLGVTVVQMVAKIARSKKENTA